MPNKRIVDVNTHVESEAMAPLIQIAWDPVVGPQAALLRFSCAKYFRLKDDGAYFGNAENDGEIQVTAAEMQGQTITALAPGGAPMGDYPVELLDALIRGLFDKLYNEKR